MSSDGWETLSNDLWGDIPRLLHQWETPQPGALPFVRCSSFPFSKVELVILLTLYIFFFVVKKRLELESCLNRGFKKQLSIQA